jgi:hypothetical protein
MTLNSSLFGTSLLVPFCAGLLFACASTDAESAPETRADDSTLVDAAKVQTVELRTRQDNCTIDHTYVVVSGIDGAAAKRINDLLARDAASLVQGEDCRGSRFSTSGLMSVSVNRRGLLSVLETGSSSIEGAAQAQYFLRTFTFDLQTGARLSLPDLLTDAGIKRIDARCNASWAEGATPSPYCKAGAPGAAFTLGNGVRYYQPEVPYALLETGLEGQLTPWADLAETFKHPRLAALKDSCVPNERVFCRCPNREAAVKTCNAEGTAYGACGPC